MKYPRLNQDTFQGYGSLDNFCLSLKVRKLHTTATEGTLETLRPPTARTPALAGALPPPATGNILHSAGSSVPKRVRESRQRRIEGEEGGHTEQKQQQQVLGSVDDNNREARAAQQEELPLVRKRCHYCRFHHEVLLDLELRDPAASAADVRIR